MKVRPFPAPDVVFATLAQSRTILRGCGRRLRRWKWGTLSLPVVAVILAVLLFPHDRAWLTGLHAFDPAHEAARAKIAWTINQYSDFPTYNIPLALVLWCYGTVAKKSAWRRLALVGFLGGALAGMLDDCFRLTLGRPRPDAQMPDGFYGLPAALRGMYQSFPSGHAAAVFGTALALLACHRPLGGLTTLYAVVVIWSRVELNRHFPSDVIVGAWMGIWVGVWVGLGAGGDFLRRGTKRSNQRTVSLRSAEPATEISPVR